MRVNFLFNHSIITGQKSSCEWTFSSLLLRAASSKEVIFFLSVSALFYEIHQGGGHGGLRYCGIELFSSGLISVILILMCGTYCGIIQP